MTTGTFDIEKIFWDCTMWWHCLHVMETTIEMLKNCPDKFFENEFDSADAVQEIK